MGGADYGCLHATVFGDAYKEPSGHSSRRLCQGIWPRVEPIFTPAAAYFAILGHRIDRCLEEMQFAWRPAGALVPCQLKIISSPKSAAQKPSYCAIFQLHGPFANTDGGVDTACVRSILLANALNLVRAIFTHLNHDIVKW
jgi:hypothetical protein